MKERKRIAPLLALVALAVWLLYRRWQQMFHSVEVEDVVLTDRTGTPRQGKRVRVQSIFDAPPEAIWAKVITPALLAHVAYPLLVFKPQDGGSLPEVWREGESVTVELLGLGCIPLGSHTVHIERIDAAQHEIQSRESGQMAEIWLHNIAVADYPDGRTLYTDQIDIYAGALTGAVACFARFFYCYRQSRWHGVVRSM